MTAIAFPVVAAWLPTWSHARASSPDHRPQSHVRSIAVLPLEDLSGTADQDYFTRRRSPTRSSEELASIDNLRVIRADVRRMRYKSAAPAGVGDPTPAAVDVERIGRSRGRQDCESPSRWSTRPGQLLLGAVQGSLATPAVLRDFAPSDHRPGLDVKLTPRRRGAPRRCARSVDPEIHAVLPGRHLVNRSTEGDLRKAVQVFERRHREGSDQRHCAHAGLAEAQIGLSGYYDASSRSDAEGETRRPVGARTRRSLADAHAPLGFIHLVYDWDGPAAASALQRALELNPTLATARLNYCGVPHHAGPA